MFVRSLRWVPPTAPLLQARTTKRLNFSPGLNAGALRIGRVNNPPVAKQALLPQNGLKTYVQQRSSYSDSGRWQRHAVKVEPGEGAAPRRWAHARRTN